MNYFKDKVYGILGNGSSNKSYLSIFTSKIKRKAMTPFIYLGGIIIGYYSIKYIYYRQLYNLSPTGLDNKIEKLIKALDENNRLQRENKILLEKIYKK
jgi:hypothetical protein